jgi:hypothetical protein
MKDSEEGLYQLLEKILFEANEPLDAQQIYDIPEVRMVAASTNRVSDYLGNIWRKGLVSRIPSGSGGRGPRWKYQWKNKVRHSDSAIEYAPKLLVNRPTVVITEEGLTMQIEMPELTIIIKQKKP